MVFFIEGTLLLISLIWMFIRKIPVFENIKISLPALWMGLILGVGILFSSIIFYSVDRFVFKERFRRVMEDKIYPLFSRVTFPEIILLALMSGFCEEFFFRGILLPEFGILFASAIFGVLHTPGKTTWFLGVWSGLIGVVFALVYKFTGNLFIPMVAHALNNFVAVVYLRYFYPEKSGSEKEKVEKKKEEDVLEPEEEAGPAEARGTIAEDVVDRIKKEAIEIARYRVKEEIEEAKAAFGEIAEETKELFGEFAREFFPDEFEEEAEELEESVPKASSPVQLLDPSMTDKQKVDLEIPEPEYDEIGEIEEDEKTLLKRFNKLPGFEEVAEELTGQKEEPERKDYKSIKEKIKDARGRLKAEEKAEESANEKTGKKDDKVKDKDKKSGKKGNGGKRSDAGGKRQEKTPKIDLDRKAPDTDDEGIGVVDKPQ